MSERTTAPVIPTTSIMTGLRWRSRGERGCSLHRLDGTEVAAAYVAPAARDPRVNVYLLGTLVATVTDPHWDRAMNDAKELAKAIVVAGAVNR